MIVVEVVALVRGVLDAAVAAPRSRGPDAAAGRPRDVSAGDRAGDVRNPTLAGAAAGILRAEGLLQQARAATRPFATANVTTTTLNTGVEFDGIGRDAAQSGHGCR